MDKQYRENLLKVAKLEIERLELKDEGSAQIIEALANEVVKLENKLQQLRLLCDSWEYDVLRVSMLAAAKDTLEYCAAELSASLNEVKV